MSDVKEDPVVKEKEENKEVHTPIEGTDGALVMETIELPESASEPA